MANNGGLTVNSVSHVHGTDPESLLVNNLRGYHKDKVTPGYHRVSIPLRIADTYIKNNLRAEDPEQGIKYPKQLQKAMNKLDDDYDPAKKFEGNMLDHNS